VAIQQLAKWFHPELFKDLDPDATFADFSQKFLPLPYQPGYWISLDGK
jgi:iron complex transport system substrate-binding protein